MPKTDPQPQPDPNNPNPNDPNNPRPRPQGDEMNDAAREEMKRREHA